MKSGYWVAIGAMLIPSAMVWAIAAPDYWSPLLIWIPTIFLAFIGVLWLRKGWTDLIAEGEQRKSEKEAEDKRVRERRRESRAMLMVLCYISKGD